MKKILWVFILAACLTGGNLWAREDGGGGDRGDRGEDRGDRGVLQREKPEVEKEAAPAKVEKTVGKQHKVFLGGRKTVPAKAPVAVPAKAGQAPVKAFHVVPANGNVQRPQNHAFQPVQAGNQKRPVGNAGPSVESKNVARPLGVKAKGGQPTVRGSVFLQHKPKPIEDKRQIMFTPKEKSVVSMPRRGPDGKTFTARLLTRAPQADHMRALGDPKFALRLNDYSRHETEHGRYYWHEDGGRRFCHYYDDWGYHWYGWWSGDDYFWTRYYSGRYWWYDRLFDRWCWWNDGYWWWQDPANVNSMYVWNDGNYVSPDADLRVPADEGQVPPSGAAKKAYSDQTGSRLVKIFGSSRDAFLYDTSEPPAFKPVFLDSNVREAQFSYDANGHTRQVVVFLNDGSVEVFDARGNAYQAPADN